MADATTPQSKALKDLADAIATLDSKNTEPVLSKDFIFKMFPKSVELPDLTREEYIQKYGPVFLLFSKIEVCIQHLLPVRVPIFTTPA